MVPFRLRSSRRRFVSASFFAVCLSLAFGVSTLAACSGESGYGAESHESVGESSESMLHRPPIQMCPDFVRTCAPSEMPICNPCCTCERGNVAK